MLLLVAVAGEDGAPVLSFRRPALEGDIAPPVLPLMRLLAGPPLEQLDAAFFFSVFAISNSSSRFRRSIKSGSSAGLLHVPYGAAPYGPGNRPRPSGPLGYERGFVDNPYHAHMSRSAPNPRPQFFGDAQANRQNVRILERPNNRNHDGGIHSGMSKLTIQDGPRMHQNPRMQSPGYFPNQPYPNQYGGFPPQRPMQNANFTPQRPFQNAPFPQQRPAQNAGFAQQRPVQNAVFPQQRPVQNAGFMHQQPVNGVPPPLPPSTWIDLYVEFGRYRFLRLIRSSGRDLYS